MLIDGPRKGDDVLSSHRTRFSYLYTYITTVVKPHDRCVVDTFPSSPSASYATAVAPSPRALHSHAAQRLILPAPSLLLALLLPHPLKRRCCWGCSPSEGGRFSAHAARAADAASEWRKAHVVHAVPPLRLWRPPPRLRARRPLAAPAAAAAAAPAGGASHPHASAAPSTSASRLGAARPRLASSPAAAAAAACAIALPL